jgi:hypothetical protein
MFAARLGGVAFPDVRVADPVANEVGVFPDLESEPAAGRVRRLSSREPFPDL